MKGRTIVESAAVVLILLFLLLPRAIHFLGEPRRRWSFARLDLRSEILFIPGRTLVDRLGDDPLEALTVFLDPGKLRRCQERDRGSLERRRPWRLSLLRESWILRSPAKVRITALS
jgi:hypothetical protein